jgi:hypothetical protein
MMFLFRVFFPVCILVVEPVRTVVCFCQENPPASSKSVLVDYLFTNPAGKVVVESFDIGDAGIGEGVPVLIRVMNRSDTKFVFSLAGSTTNKVQMLNSPVEIPSGENGLVQMVVKTPDLVKSLNDRISLRASLGDDVHLHLGFTFRYSNVVIFAKSFSVFSLELPEGEPAGRQLTVQLPVEVSDVNIFDHIAVVADTSLQSAMFSIVRSGPAGFVEVKFPAELIAKKQISGKVYLKVGDKLVSEAHLTIKKRRDVELLPDYVTLRFDPKTKEFCGEVIAKLNSGNTPIEHLKIEAEHCDDLPITISVGKMSNSTGRVYLRIKGDESPKNDDLIWFQMSTPLKNESQVLPVVIVR